MKFTNEEIISELSNKFTNEEITLDTKFKEDLKADSIDLYQMLIEIEDKHDIIIDDEKAMGIKTVGDLINVLNKD